MDRKTEALQREAIDAALAGQWKTAISINGQIIELNAESLDAHLRLGFAYLQMGNLKKSKSVYLRALKLQPANQIAQNNLEKIKILKKQDGLTKKGKQHEKKSGEPDNDIALNPELFINVRGKTKVVTLKNVGQAHVLARLKIGQQVYLKTKKRRVEIRTEDGEYIGALPDDISKRLIFFLNAESEYSVYVKEASKNSVDVFLREEKLGGRVKRYTSFPDNMQDDLKKMAQAEESDAEGFVEEQSASSEEEVEGDSPVDIEQLAEQVEKSEVYPGGTASEDEEEEE